MTLTSLRSTSTHFKCSSSSAPLAAGGAVGERCGAAAAAAAAAGEDDCEVATVVVVVVVEVEGVVAATAVSLLLASVRDFVLRPSSFSKYCFSVAEKSGKCSEPCVIK